MKQKRISGKMTKTCAMMLALMVLCSSTCVVAAPKQYLCISCTPKFHSAEGCLQYIQTHGMESYCSKDTLDLKQFLIDNPDLVAAGIVELDKVWDWILIFDKVSPRKMHSIDPEEEYYCRARNKCIDLGIYGPSSPKSVKEKCYILHVDLCHACDYDYSYARYGYKDIMDDQTGVCNAFATYAMLMLTIAGVENGYVVGPNHVWNAVLSEDGGWYQIDYCWDACHGYGESYFWMYERCNVDASNISLSGNFMVPTLQDSYIMQDLR